jgi:hypothetical protein
MIIGPRDSKPVLLFEYPAHKFPYGPDAFQRILLFACPPCARRPRPGQIANQFVFGLNDSRSLIFGISSQVGLRDSPAASFLGPIDAAGTYYLCSITTLPALAAHFRFHEFLFDHLIGRCQEAPAPLGVAPNGDDSPEGLEAAAGFGHFVPALTQHPEDAAFVAVIPSGIPVQFRLALDFYYHLQVDKAQSQTHRLNERYSVTIPKMGSVVPELASAGFDVMFSLLGVENIVRVFRSVLLEQRMLVVGSDIGIVTLCTLMVLPLSLPMVYKAALLPYLPDSDHFLAFLDSPIPFCFGILNTERTAGVALSGDITIINLDERRVYYPDDIPHLPHASKLRVELHDVLARMDVLVPRRPDQAAEFWTRRDYPEVKKRWGLKYSINEEDSQELITVFINYVTDLVREERICGCRVRDTTDPDHPKVGFVREVYMLGVVPKDTDFFNQFLQTQTFAAFFESAAL